MADPICNRHSDSNLLNMTSVTKLNMLKVASNMADPICNRHSDSNIKKARFAQRIYHFPWKEEGVMNIRKYLEPPPYSNLDWSGMCRRQLKTLPLLRGIFSKNRYTFSEKGTNFFAMLPHVYKIFKISWGSHSEPREIFKIRPIVRDFFKTNGTHV